MTQIDTKKCTRCGEEKPLDGFGKDRRGKYGRKSICKPCENAKLAAWREANRETKYKEHMERARIRSAETYKKDKATWLGRCKKWRSENKEYKAAKDKQWQQENKDRVNAAAKKRRDADRATFNAKNRAKAYKYADKKRASTAFRRAKKAKATPPWVDKAAIQFIYCEAAKLSQLHGVNYHVDHIVPLVHPHVSGLHVPWNLQIIPAALNHSKSNKFVCGPVA